MTATTAADPTRFREVLGNFPTGVVLVTAIAADGDPVGMILGTFASVSLDPPIVGFMPTKDSSSWARLRTAERFCVNVLGADQTELCRSFSRKNVVDKFAGVSWTPSWSGAPVVDGVIASIDCTTREIIDAGDHDIVLGDVVELQLHHDKMPLLFFQGGFGRFSTHSLVLGSEVGIIEAARSAELARLELEELANDLDVEVTLSVRSGDTALIVAVATGQTVAPGARLGVHLPQIPPLGALLAAYSSEEDQASWVARRHPGDPVTAEEYRSRLDDVRERGWTLDTANHETEPAFYDAFDRLGDKELTPSQYRALLDIVRERSADHGIRELDDDRLYDVAGIMAPVRDADGAVRSVVRAAQFPRQASASTVRGWIRDVVGTADRIGRRLAGAAMERP